MLIKLFYANIARAKHFDLINQKKESFMNKKKKSLLISLFATVSLLTVGTPEKSSSQINDDYSLQLKGRVKEYNQHDEHSIFPTDDNALSYQKWMKAGFPDFVTSPIDDDDDKNNRSKLNLLKRKSV